MRYVFDFAEGDRGAKDLLGGKGANLAEMTRIELPVPPGFTITTEACRAYRAAKDLPAGLDAEIARHLERLEQAMDKRLGDDVDPLLVSVRSGAAFSMPGMMETVLNVGLNDITVQALAKQTSDSRFAWDSYRRLIQMYGRTVMGVNPERFDRALDDAKQRQNVTDDTQLTASDLEVLVATFCALIEHDTGRPFPQDPREQMDLAIRAVFDSWDGARAKLYRRQERISDELGTAVNVMAMVFGNLGEDSGTGVAFTRDPASGRQGAYGDYLPNAQGEDVVSGTRNTLTLLDMQKREPQAFDELTRIMSILETHYRDLCDIEFTVEKGKLWMLQTRVGKRTPEASFRIAIQFVDEELIEMDEALTRVSGAQLARLMFPQVDAKALGEPLVKGIPASPGAAVGRAIFDSKRAAVRAAAGDDVVLVRRETNPDDLGGMIAAEGVLTSRGGKTSHAAVVARGMGKPCVVGADKLHVDIEGRYARAEGGTIFREGDVISVDGTTGAVYIGAVPVMPSPVVQALEEGADAVESNELVQAVTRLLEHADRQRRLRVRANADTSEDAARARRFGAEGIGLARTEHMFLGDRKQYVVRLVLATSDEERQGVYRELLPLQRADAKGLIAAMDGLPVTIRLLDPPLHEFLPDITELSVKVAMADSHGELNTESHHLLAAVRRMHETNPMMGMRGVRLGLVLPGLFALQVRAVAEAVADRIEAGGEPRAEIMVPLVATLPELTSVRTEAAAVIAEIAHARGVELDIPIGTMIELPRAAVTAGKLAEAADFFSFGTNDLTQTTWGFSRDDVEGAFFTDYLAAGIFSVSPFESIDVDGVGELIRMAVASGRTTNNDLHLGVCGEHGGDPDSIHFFESVGLDYVSCSPFRVPVARLEAGRAAITTKDSDTR
ncbi:MAG TPA: pyruvate, phosphate dikinase [Actinomycetes bacterium]|nr:pyruvate, phosphate dikinase [Actinomycetes bacterium]